MFSGGLPIPMDGPIIFAAPCCQVLRLVPLMLWEVLPMCKNRPIALSKAAANGVTWTHCFSRRHFRCPRMGPLHFQNLLLITLLGPINVLRGLMSKRWADSIHSSCFCDHNGPSLVYWQHLPEY